MEDETRATARQYAAEALENGDDVGWFERLYADSARGAATVPWTDDEPNPLLVGQVADGAGRRALVVGCGFGDDAAHLAELGWAVTAFDVSPTAVETAKRRFAERDISFITADLLNAPQWQFDLVVEIYTVQTLTGAARRQAIDAIRGFVAPGGTLVVIARAREEDEPSSAMPWPLTRAEVAALAPDECDDGAIESLYDGEEPPVRRWRATFRRR
ncbi:class I SAM-dependent methyltransferase [Stackebrandtia soli]|uniref:class I SAM-dependent methyltransferase n=1 Tax=Stackebrandtia soli TaxID=1892856 RepID=UPI0039E7B9CA